MWLLQEFGTVFSESSTEQKLQDTKIQKLINKLDVSYTYYVKWTQPVWDMERSMTRIRVIRKRESRFRVSTCRAVSVSVVISQRSFCLVCLCFVFWGFVNFYSYIDKCFHAILQFLHRLHFSGSFLCQWYGIAHFILFTIYICATCVNPPSSLMYSCTFW